MKRGLIALLVIAVVGGGYAGVRWWRGESGARADAGHVTLYGNIDLRDAQLAFNGNDRIAEVRVEEGEAVEPGQVLGRLRTERLKAQLAGARAREATQRETLRRLENGSRPEEIAQAEAQVAAGEARVANAKLNLSRLEQMEKTGATTVQARDDARAALRVERANLEVQRKALVLARKGPRVEDIAAARAQLAAYTAERELTEVLLADCVLTAPARGVIQSRLLEPGEMASPSRPALTLALTDPKWARAYVSEPDLGKVASGMQAEVTSDSFPGEVFRGWVGFIAPQSEFTPKSVETTELRPNLVYEVRVYVHDPQDRLRLGQPVTVVVDREAPRVSAEARAAVAPVTTRGAVKR